MSKKGPAGPDTSSTKPPVDQQETLKRLARNRVNRVVKDLQLVGNLVAYKPTGEQTAAIERALAMAHKQCVERLKGSTQTSGGFTL